jgi:two-component system phosphate regulon response regulator PhoB
MSKVLVIDDEADTLGLVSMHLRKEGHTVVTVDDGLKAFSSAVTHSPDIIILDMQLPGLDGSQVYKSLREDSRTGQTPVVALSAKNRLEDRIKCLEDGVDDYMTKPFSPRELVLRVAAVLKRSGKVTPHDRVQNDSFCLNMNSMTLNVCGRQVPLTTTELKLVSTLLETPDTLHHRLDLMNHVWGSTKDSGSRTLDTHIKRLRQKLGEYGGQIKTVRGQGFVFASRVPFRKE